MRWRLGHGPESLNQLPTWQMLAPLAPGDIEQFTATLRACIQALSQDR